MKGVTISVVLSVALLLGACSAGGDPTPTPDQEGTTRTVTNPVYPYDFPDPQVLPDPGGGFLGIATNGNGMNVQTINSDDLVDWTQGTDALPAVAGWSSSGKVWAPEIIAWPDSTYRLYYSTKAPDPAWQCVSVAISETLAGPYRDESPKPLVCEMEEGGSIDASPFVDDDGTAYLFWKNDGNAVGVDTWIRAAALSDDGLGLVGDATNLLKQDLPWEGHLVEGPAVVKAEGSYHMFYSANDYGSDRYAVGHAVADSPLGPFVKDGEPVLVTNELAAGPGHCQLFKDGDQWWMVYHAWLPGQVGDSVSGRQMWLSKVRFDGKSVQVQPPTLHPMG